MSRVFTLVVVVFLVIPVGADDKDWTGKSVKLKGSVKLGSKLGGGLVRDGAALEKGKTFVVKSDDGGFLELVGQTGYISKSEAEVVAGREMPRKDDPTAKEDDENLWAVGTAVLPKKRPKQIQFGDRDADGKQVYFEMSGIMPMYVRKDAGDGWLRIHDGYREGWVSKDDVVTFKDAPMYWDKAVKADPSDAWVLYMRGVSWMGKGEPDNAIKDFNVSIQLESGNAFVYNSRGNAWRIKKEYDKAIVDYTEAIRIDPKDALAYNNRGAAWCNKKEYDKAIADCTEAIQLDPKGVHAYIGRGNARSDKKEYDKAIADYTEAIRLDPKGIHAYIGRGNAWSDKKEYDKAIADYTEVIRLDPKNIRSYISRANATNNKKEYDKAIDDLTQAIRLNPTYGHAFFDRGCVWLEKKEYEKAIADFTETIKLDENNSLAWVMRGRVWREKKEYEKAIAEFDHAIKLEPKNEAALGGRAIAYAKWNKNNKAVNDFEAALKINQSEWIQIEYALFLASCSDTKYRDGKRAIELAKKAIAKAGRDADWEYYAALAAAYAETGDFELAVTEQRKAVEDKSLDKQDHQKMESRLELYRVWLLFDGSESLIDQGVAA